jgi:hypothetical protein
MFLLFACADPAPAAVDPTDSAPPVDTAADTGDTAAPLDPAARIEDGDTLIGRLADRDGDDVDDLLVRTRVVRLPVGDETLDAVTIGQIEAAGADVWLGTADLDGDGAPEVLSYDSIENMDYHVVQVDPSDVVELGVAPLWSGYWGSAWWPGESEIFVTPDITGDGVDDLELASDSGDIRVIRPGDPWTVETLPAPSDTYARVEGVGDLDGDGVSDCVATTWPALLVYTGAYDGSPPVATLTADGAWRTLGGDFDGDGYGDVAVTLGDDGIVQLRGPLSDGDLRADAAAHLPESLGDHVELATGDLDGDGRADLVVVDPDASDDRGEVRLTLGLGAGEVAPDALWRGAPEERLGTGLLLLEDGQFAVSSQHVYVFEVP